MSGAVLVATMAIVTMATRFLPFVVFRRETPEYVSYLGRVLPPAIIGMLVVYCLRDVSLAASPYGIPELVAVACVVAVQAWRRNSLASILVGTVMYMALVQVAP
ncbi:MAG: branched-chain amino acid transporter AzlD [Olsenella sp.]|nr:branched-chain amino acid transporter AzlD [Olsenella sp.]